VTGEAQPARTVRLVLDTSAIEAWSSGSVAVGELLAETDNEHGAVIVPSACLIEAAARKGSVSNLIDVLVRHPATFLLSDDPDDWRMLSNTRRIIGTLDSASAAWFAIECDVDVLTRQGHTYAELGNGDLTLEIVED
jgi:hypothetical protein